MYNWYYLLVIYYNWIEFDLVAPGGLIYSKKGNYHLINSLFHNIFWFIIPGLGINSFIFSADIFKNFGAIDMAPTGLVNS